MEDLEFVDSMISKLKLLKSTIQKREKLSQRAFEMNHSNTRRQVEKANTDLNWCCMEVDKETTAFARAFKGSILDVDTGEKEYRPSGFHHYKG